MMKLYARLLRILPTFLAVKLLQSIATKSQRSQTYPDQHGAMSHAVRLQYGKTKVAWSWGDGPLVIMVHGWNGRAAQFAPLAVNLAGRGFRCVAIEVTGHGESPGDNAAWGYFIDDLADLVAELRLPIYALIGHSAGGLAMMAARSLKNLRAERYACICTPSHPFPPIRAIRERLDPPTRVIDGYKRYIAKQFGTTWDELESGSAFRDAGEELMLFYDENDKFVDHAEGDRILQWCIGAQLRKSKAHGHAKVLSAPELHEQVASFLHGDRARAAISIGKDVCTT